MQPKREPEQPQRELFQIDLEQLIDMSHPLVRLGHFIDWHSFERTLGSTTTVRLKVEQNQLVANTV